MCETTQQPEQKKKIIFSGIQPHRGIHPWQLFRGNSKLGASCRDEYNCVYSIVNMHAITVRQDPLKLRAQTLDAYALIMACGIDPKKSIFFIQSHVKTHAELAWVLNCYTQFGELNRMTQFKDKSRPPCG